jgi:hypothetical protein
LLIGVTYLLTYRRAAADDICDIKPSPLSAAAAVVAAL